MKVQCAAKRERIVAMDTDTHKDDQRIRNAELLLRGEIVPRRVIDQCRAAVSQMEDDLQLANTDYARLVEMQAEMMMQAIQARLCELQGAHEEAIAQCPSLSPSA